MNSGSDNRPKDNRVIPDPIEIAVTSHLRKRRNPALENMSSGNSFWITAHC